MAQPLGDKKFSQRLDRTITEQGIRQTELARASGLRDSQINALKKGVDTTRITKTPVRKCIEGLIRLLIITTVDEIKAWIRSYYIERKANNLPIKKLSRQEWGELVQLLNQVQEQELADREKALQKPKYFTIWQTPLIGRDEIIEEILTKLQKEGIRFLTLVGLPGVGKTELALQIEKLAQKQEHFTNVKFLNLETVSKVDVAQDMIDAYLLKINTKKRTLLILDNCEQIIKLREELYKHLLRKYEQLTILATSRVEFSQEKLEIEKLQTSAAIQLFCEVAKRRNNRFTPTIKDKEAIATICKYFDGLPLAIRLAATWVKELGVTGVKTLVLQGKFLKKKDTFVDTERQKSLYNLIEASYELLKDEEQIIFRRLSYFQTHGMGNFSGFDINEADIICNFTHIYRNEWWDHYPKINVFKCDLNDQPLVDAEGFINILKKLSDHHLITFIEYNLIKIAHKTLVDYAWQKVCECNNGEDEWLVERNHLIELEDRRRWRFEDK